MEASEVFVNVAIEVDDVNWVNEEEVGEEVLGESITKTQEGGYSTYGGVEKG